MNVHLDGFYRDGLVFLDDKQARSLDQAQVRAGDVLLNITGASIGRVTQAPEDMDGARVNQHVCIVRTNAGINASFLSHYLASPAVQEMIWNEQYGVTRQALTKTQILEFAIPLPPLAEQQRIVAALDAVLSKVGNCQTRLARIPTLLKRFRQAVLAAACSGRLTADWRGQQSQLSSAEELVVKPQSPKTTSKKGSRQGRLWGAGVVPELTDDERESVPSNWKWAKVYELNRDTEHAVQVGPMSMQSRDFEETGIPVLNVGCVQSGWIDASKLDFMPEEKAVSFSRYRIETDDILFTRSGTVGRCAIATERCNGWLMTFHLLRARTSPQICEPRYLLHTFMGAPSIRRQTDDAAIGSTRAGFNTRLLANLDVPLPPLPEQQEIVRRVDALFAVADKLEARYELARRHVDRLAQSVLAKAFRGELVPTEHALAAAQGRDYETAKQLLERVRAAPTAPQERRPPKRRKPAAKKS
jgi:type I restriction enzyme S subunit